MVDRWLRVLRCAMFEKMVIRCFTDRHCSRLPSGFVKMTAFDEPRTVRADENGEQANNHRRVPIRFPFLFSSENRSRERITQFKILLQARIASRFQQRNLSIANEARMSLFGLYISREVFIYIYIYNIYFFERR